MTIFLTSIIGPQGTDRKIKGIYTKNRFLENLHARWKENARILIMTADPASSRNDGWRETIQSCFADGGVSFAQIDICDDRDLGRAEQIREYDVLVLAGGHVQTQNDFFRRIGLVEKMAGFDGMVIGISAGSMNSASLVYTHVERKGETRIPRAERFIPGLGLTERMVLPHFQQLQKDRLDCLRVIRDVAYPDSVGREFLCLDDGSYILIEDGRETLYGKAYRLKDRRLRRICRDGESILLD